MPGQHGTERRTLDGAPLMVRLPAELRARVEAAAAGADLSAAAYLRRLATEAIDGAAELAMPSPPRRAVPPPPPEAVREVARLREVVGELAGAMVRAAVLTRTGGAAGLHAEIEAALPGIRAAALDLDRLKAAWLTGPPTTS